MSFSTTIDITDFVNRGVEMLLANILLRVPNPNEADSLVSGIVAQEPPIEQSPDTTIMPAILVWPSKTPFRETENFGRSDLNTAGAKYYHLEFYNVCITRGISRRDAQKKVQLIASVVRDVYQKNLRMTDPATGLTNIAATNNVISVPFVLRSTDPNIQAINVICRPDVPIDLR